MVASAVEEVWVPLEDLCHPEAWLALDGLGLPGIGGSVPASPESQRLFL